MIDFDPKQFLVFGEAAVRDTANRIRYGAHAPKVAECIWVRPADIERCICKMPDTINRRSASGRVIDFNAAHIAYRVLEETSQFRACHRRWCDHVAWEQTEEFAAMLEKIRLTGRSMRFRSETELRGRYRVLDKIYDEVSRTRFLRTRKQISPLNFREYGGVQVAIDPDGRPVLGKSGGFHRIALAKILKIDVIPAELGLVDVNAVGKLEPYRRPPPTVADQSARADAVLAVE